MPAQQPDRHSDGPGPAAPASRAGTAWFRAVYEQSPVAIELYDSGGTLIDANPACLTLFGVEDRKQLEGFTLFEDRNLPSACRQQLLNGESVSYDVDFDFELDRKYGLFGARRRGKATLHVQATPFHLEGGNLAGYVVHVLDVSDRSRVAADLARSAGRFRAIFENAPDAFFIMDLDGRFVDVNRTTEELAGRCKEELVGKTLAESAITSEAETTRAMEMLSRAGEDESTGPDEIRLTRTDGQVIDVEISSFPMDLDGHRVLLGIARDITERRQAEEELRESEERFRALFEQSLDAIYIGELDGSIVDVNEAWLKMFGYDRSEVATLNAVDCYADPSERKDFLLRILSDGRVADVVRYRRKDGRVLECQRILVARRNRQGEIVGVQGVNRDVTEQRRVERALRESEQRFRSFFEQSLDAVYIGRMDGSVIDVNRAWLDMFGYSRDDLARFNVSDIYEDPGARGDFLRRLEQYGHVEDEVRFKRKDDTSLLCQRAVVGRRDDEGRITTIQGVIRDITESRQREEALRASEEEYRRLFEQSRDSIHVASVDGRILNVNAAAVGLFGYSREELLAMRVSDLYADPAVREQVAEQARDRGGLEDFELAFRRKNGEVRDGLVMTAVLKDADGGVLGFQTLVRDITERKRAERQLWDYSERLNRAMSAGNLSWWQMELPSGRVIFDERKATTLGRDPSEFRHYMDFCALLHPDDYDAAMKSMRDHLEGWADRYEVEYRIRRVDGEYVWFRDVGGVTSRYPDGSPSVITGVVVDITTLKAAESRLEESNRELQRLAAGMQVAREEERAAVAWELHDEVAQALSAIKMDIYTCSNRLPREALNEVQPTMRRLHALLDETIEKLRRLYTGLVPVMLEDLGLAAAIEWRLQSFVRETGIAARFNGLNEVTLPTERHELIMYRVLQEALDNVGKHAGATTVTVDLQREGETVLLRVSDDGVGLLYDDVALGQGLGIAAMKERVQSIGGELCISSGMGGGTVVEARVPTRGDSGRHPD